MARGVFSQYTNLGSDRGNQYAFPKSNDSWLPNQSFNQVTGKPVAPYERGTWFNRGTKVTALANPFQSPGHLAILAGRGGK